MDPKRLEGVVPKQAVCAHCGYQFGGQPITGGHIQCPECGRYTDFLRPLLATGEVSEPDPVWRRVRRMIGLLVLMAVIAGIVASLLI